LSDLVEGGTLGVGDVLVYKRTFNLANVTVEKDVMVRSFDSNAPPPPGSDDNNTLTLQVAACGGPSKSIVVLVPSGTTKYLPSALASSSMPTEDLLPDDDSLLEMSITTPSSLESGILDTDSRVDKPHRTNGNAWKHLSVWKSLQGGGTDGFTSPERGGRQETGTLHYLRSSVYYGR
jgi:hypothetical protein